MRGMIAALLLVVGACTPPEQASRTPSSAPVAAPSIEGLPAGAYVLDASHASLTFRVSHLGFSNYTAGFDKFDAALQLDPANPGAARVTAHVDPQSLDLPSPPAGFLAELLGAQWLDAARFPEITFVSTAVDVTGAGAARVTGDLTLHGVTKPIMLDAVFHGGYPGHPMDPNARIGFSARGSFKRSDFGVAFGVPAPGTNMGVGDEVEVIIDAEFTGPAWTPAEQAQ